MGGMADQTMRIEYNQDMAPLAKLLAGVKRAGDFYVSGVVEIPLPKVEIAGLGVLSFPVPAGQIPALIQQATRAPYGRGEATLLDETVRKVWQVPPEKVALGGKSWAANFDGILKDVIAGLGCEGGMADAELYKLLVYDTGGFFLAHRDTEKTEGMFGTLVVVLPSVHRGGELVIRHAGREVVVDLSGAEVSEIGFAAFYADCEHEVRPITSGNRVCLVYNLVQKRGAKALQAPDYAKEITAAAKLLEQQLTLPEAPAKLAWLLEHQYSPDGLSFASLKSDDAARAKVLVQAAELAGCAVHLGIVHIEESGAAEPTYQPSRRRGWGRHRYDDDEDEDAEAGEDFEVVEVCDWHHYVSQWRDVADQRVDFGEIPLAPGELLPDGALDDEKPDVQRLMEASGNEGASFERSYHRAAIVIWRRENYAEVLLQSGVAAVLPYLKERIEGAEAKGAPATARAEAVALARRLVKVWAEKAAPQYHAPIAKRDQMVRLLNQLDTADLLAEFIREVVTREYDGSENAVLVAGAGLLGATATGRLFAEVTRQHLKLLPDKCVDLLASLAGKSKLAVKPEWHTALREIAAAAVSQLGEIGTQPVYSEWMDWQTREQPKPVYAGLVTQLLDVLGDLKAPELRIAAAKQFIARPKVFDPVTTLAPALAEVREGDAAVQSLWNHAVEFLLRRSGQPPAAPRDWRQEVTVTCKCAECRELQAFALNPAEQVHRFRTRQERRDHLANQIARDQLDMTHVTDRKGSPQTLVCTKDRRSYQRRCEEYRRDIAALGSLAESAGKLPERDPGVLERIAEARARAGEWGPRGNEEL